MVRYVGVCLEEVLFFFQAEDGIRDYKVTGVQTCALPISFVKTGRLRHSSLGYPRHCAITAAPSRCLLREQRTEVSVPVRQVDEPLPLNEIGRASCRERV